MADMPTARWQAASATIGGIIYVFGGNNSYCCNNWLTTVEAFDAETDTWTAGLAPIPGTGRGFLSATPVGGSIYVMGGVNSYVVPTFSDNFVYHPATNSWSTGSSLPRPRSHHCAAEANGRIYLIGGEYRFQDGQTFFPTEVDVYDPATDTWSLAAPIPNPGHFSACEVLCGKIYVLGEGVHGAPGAPTVDIYDPATDSWSSGIDLPQAKGSHCSGAVEDSVYAIGGINATNGLLDTVISSVYGREGACCIRGSCGLMRASQCAAIHGEFAGDGSACYDVPCPVTCQADIMPCPAGDGAPWGDGKVDIFDILGVLDAFAGNDCCAPLP